MIADVQTQELVLVAAEEQLHLTVVQDLELMFVGGGGASGVAF